MEVEFTPVCSSHLLKESHPLTNLEDLIHYLLLDVEGSDVWIEWLKKVGIPEKNPVGEQSYVILMYRFILP
tara:strand:- start:251 stop:463 length:213 start_codon:yes stop_codon:yes gene_type:complete